VSVQKPLVKSASLLVLVGALLFLGADSLRKGRSFAAVTALGEQGRPAPALEAGSPTGREGGRRAQILQSTDGYHWVMQTQQMIATGEWRLRQVDYDNAPGGREVHWNSPLHGWLAAVAWVDHAMSGQPWSASVESAALHAGPWLLGLFLVVLVPWSGRRLGLVPAALVATGLVAIAPLGGEFGTGSFDHHGAAAACALMTGLFLLAGWTASADDARRMFIASGIAGAAGLWINAATQIPVLAGIGIGAVLAHALARAEKLPPVNPHLWRTWGWAGGLASLAFYLVEYFPSHLGWRLEVNHPLHALAWVGAGDLLARWCNRRQSAANHPPNSSASRVWPLASLLAVAAPAVVVFLAPSTFVVRDPFLWRLHVDYISEFAPLFAQWPGFEALFVRINILPAFGLAATWLILRGGLTPRLRGLVVLALPAATVATMLALSQQRWVHVASALWLVVLAAAAMATVKSGFAWTGLRRLTAGLFVALVLLPYPLKAGWDALRGREGLSRENVRQFAVRDLAFWLRRHTGADPVMVLSGPTVATELVYHGGFRTIGTLYWENREGLRTLVDIFGAADAARAKELIERHGVTHIILLPWGSFADEAARLARVLRDDDPAPLGAFAQNLVSPGHGLPDWLRPLPYRLPAAEQFKDMIPLVLEVTPGQSPTDAATRAAHYLAAMGNPAAAQELLGRVLAAQPDHLVALVTLAQVQRAGRDRTAHGATMRRVSPLLADADSLAPGDCVALAGELAAAGMAEAARSQIVRCWESLDAAAIRRLPPEPLRLLLIVTRDARVTAPPALLSLAESLHEADQRRP
jgi:hypothetical protein